MKFSFNGRVSTLRWKSNTNDVRFSVITVMSLDIMHDVQVVAPRGL